MINRELMPVVTRQLFNLDQDFCCHVLYDSSNSVNSVPEAGA